MQLHTCMFVCSLDRCMYAWTVFMTLCVLSQGGVPVSANDDQIKVCLYASYVCMLCSGACMCVCVCACACVRARMCVCVCGGRM